MAKRNPPADSDLDSDRSSQASFWLMEADPDSWIGSSQSYGDSDSDSDPVSTRSMFISSNKEKPRGKLESRRRNLLLRILRGLESEDLAKLKRHLLALGAFPASETSLEAADAKQLQELLISRSDVREALNVTEKALWEIGLSRQACWLHFSLMDFRPDHCLRWAFRRLKPEQAERFCGQLGLKPSLEEYLDSGYRTESKTQMEEHRKRQEQGLKMLDFRLSSYNDLELPAKVLKDIGEENLAACLWLCVEEHKALECLKGVLLHLERIDLERFVRKLCDLPVQEGIERIPSTQLQEGLSAEKLAKELFRFYGRDAALEMGAKVLKALNRESLVDKLLFHTGMGKNQDPESQTSLLEGKEPSEEMVNQIDLEGHFLCCRRPRENFPERMRPDVVWDSKRKHDTYRFCPTEAGSFRCCYTDLIFEVKGTVIITYEFGSWEKHLSAMDAQKLTIASPLFNIQADPMEAVAAIHFPHFLCLAGEDSSQVRILHFVREGVNLEEPDPVGPFHAVLRNPTFSPFGVVLNWSRFKVHAVALLYQELEITIPKFHLYILPNDASIIQSVDKCEKMRPSKNMMKPSGLSKSLRFGSHLFLREVEQVKICPTEIKLRYLDAGKVQQHLEIFAKHMKDKLELHLIEKSSNEVVWKTYIIKEELKTSKSQILNTGGKFQCVLPEMHFIERYRKELIQRTTNVEEILDHLLHHRIVNQEQYQIIFSKGTHQEKMRELYNLMRGWNKCSKDKFYEVLLTKQSILIKDLKEKEVTAHLT